MGFTPVFVIFLLQWKPILKRSGENTSVANFYINSLAYKESCVEIVSNLLIPPCRYQLSLCPSLSFRILLKLETIHMAT